MGAVRVLPACAACAPCNATRDAVDSAVASGHSPGVLAPVECVRVRFSPRTTAVRPAASGGRRGRCLQSVHASQPCRPRPARPCCERLTLLLNHVLAPSRWPRERLRAACRTLHPVAVRRLAGAAAAAAASWPSASRRPACSSGAATERAGRAPTCGLRSTPRTPRAGAAAGAGRRAAARRRRRRRRSSPPTSTGCSTTCAGTSQDDLARVVGPAPAHEMARVGARRWPAALREAVRTLAARGRARAAAAARTAARR